MTSRRRLSFVGVVSEYLVCSEVVIDELCDGKYLARDTFTTRSQKGNVAHAAQRGQ